MTRPPAVRVADDREPGEAMNDVLRRRLRSVSGPVLSRHRAVVVLDAGTSGRWTVTLDRGDLHASRGSHPRPTTTVAAPVDVLLAVVDGQASGLQAFLDGQLTVRGNLGLALALDALFGRDDHPDQWPHAGIADAGGIETTFLESGPAGAPPVVMLHGLGATNASLLPLLWDLGADHRVIAPDLPGFGMSAKPRGGYHAAWFAQWLVDFLDAVDLPDAVLVGNSLGGRIAVEVGLRHPERVRGVVSLCGSPAFRRMRQWVPLVRVLRPEMAVVGVPVSHSFVVDAIRSMFSVPDRLAAAWYDAAADEFRQVFASRPGRHAFLAAARQIYLEDAFGAKGFWDRLPGLVPPSLFVWGDRDRLVPASFARHVEHALPGATSIVLADCGHVPQFEHPELTARLVRGFVSGC